MSSKDYIYCYQGIALRVAGDTAVIGKNADPYNPLELPDFTMRLKFAQGYDPSANGVARTYVLVDADENIWDCTGNYRPQVTGFPTLTNNTYLTACISTNLRTPGGTGFLTGMINKFKGCTNLVSVSIPCTDHITLMGSMFEGCTSLTAIPLIDTSACLNMNRFAYGCVNVQSGALALYQQASTQATPPTTHTLAFSGCGSNTTTGAAELAQIPTSWGGTMAE